MSKHGYQSSTSLDEQIKQAQADPQKLAALLRELLDSHQSEADIQFVLSLLSPISDQLPYTQAVDLLERSCVLARLETLQAVWNCFKGNFAYTGWALALALRCSKEDSARWLLHQGVDLLGPPCHPPKIRALLPPEGTFTRFDLVRTSPTLFLNNLDPTVSTEIFENFGDHDQLAGSAYSIPVDIRHSCSLIAQLARESLFDTLVFNDIFRAALVKVWQLLRNQKHPDVTAASACLNLARELMELHTKHGMGDKNIELILANLIVPKADPKILSFVCDVCPQAFLGRALSLSWLKDDIELICSMVPHLALANHASVSATQASKLLQLLASAGRMSEVQLLATWPQASERTTLMRAMLAAAQAGHGELSLWLLKRLQETPDNRNKHAAPTCTLSTRTPTTRTPSTQTPLSAAKSTAQPVPKSTAPSTQMPTPASGQAPASASPQDELALQVMELARDKLLAENPFLTAAAHLLRFEVCKYPQQSSNAQGKGDTLFRCDGESIHFDAALVLKAFQQTQTAPVHDVAHMLIHCLLLHPFNNSTLDSSLWNFACDIVAEARVIELVGPRSGERGDNIAQVLDELQRSIAFGLTSERVYRYLQNSHSFALIHQWRSAFYVDDHRVWHDSHDSLQSSTQNHAEKNAQNSPQDSSMDVSQQSAQEHTQSSDQEQSPSAGKKSAHESAHESPHDNSSGECASQERASQDDTSPESMQNCSNSKQDEQGSGQLSSRETGSSFIDALPDYQTASKAQFNQQTLSRKEELKRRWQQSARTLSVDLATRSQAYSNKTQSLIGEIKTTAHTRIDFREFLRQFAIAGSDWQLSDDEFDTIFYTYGLKLYKDMPLIEPLEQKEEQKIRDFVIVIDTSSSVTHKIVQDFVNTTFDVLSTASSFFQQVNIHIIQADQKVQSDTKISTLAQLNQWRHSIKLYGHGGTDFRPAFRYVDRLLVEGEFVDLQGLIYFTDGWGIYPERIPPYKTAFVFYDEDHRSELVPAWALQITLRPGECESMSVYGHQHRHSGS